MTNALTHAQIHTMRSNIVNAWCTHTDTCIACQNTEQAACIEYEHFIKMLSYWTLREIQTRHEDNASFTIRPHTRHNTAQESGEA